MEDEWNIVEIPRDEILEYMARKRQEDEELEAARRWQLRLRFLIREVLNQSYRLCQTLVGDNCLGTGPCQRLTDDTRKA